MSDSLLIISLGALLPIIVIAILFKVWPRSGKIGLTTQTVYCPDCGQKAPMIRKPMNLRQLLWGGWTCRECACEFDRYGKEQER